MNTEIKSSNLVEKVHTFENKIEIYSFNSSLEFIKIKDDFVISYDTMYNGGNFTLSFHTFKELVEKLNQLTVE